MFFLRFVVAMSNLVHDVEAMQCLTVSGNLFRNISDARETANYSLLSVSLVSLMFKKKY